jgi:peptidoglycan hydrolase-like protein with peptidoglycan-binding domain
MWCATWQRRNRDKLMTARPTLRRGDRGPDVTLVQTCLGVALVDGVFGTLTESAVKTFQYEQGLAADGIVGPLTWAKLEQVYNFRRGRAP